MRIEIDIPKEFEEHFNQDKFKDSLERIMADIWHSLEIGNCLCAGNYEYETIKMLEKAFEDSKSAYLVEKVVEELELHSFELGTDTLPVHYVRLNDAIEIVKQGGVSDASDNVCEWKFEDEEANLYLTGCQQRQLTFEGTPKENGYRYCHYCGKKILCKE